MRIIQAKKTVTKGKILEFCAQFPCSGLEDIESIFLEWEDGELVDITLHGAQGRRDFDLDTSAQHALNCLILDIEVA